MKSLIISLLFLQLSFSLIYADGVYTQTIDLGNIAKGKVYTKTVNSIPLPASSFELEGIQIVLINKTSNKPWERGNINVASIDFTSGSKKLVSFTASNYLSQISFPAPYALKISGALDLNVAISSSNKLPHDCQLSYYIKWTSSVSVYPVVRMATSAVANFSSFHVPKGTGGFTISHSVVWASNGQTMNFLAATSPGIISLSLAEGSTVICKSTPVVVNKEFQYMSLCPGVHQMTKGATYTTTAVYDNSIARTAFANFGFYQGFVSTTTHTSTTHSTTHTSGPSTTHSSGPATSTHSSGPTSSGPHSSGPSSSGPHSSGPSSSGPHSSGPSSSGPGPASSSTGFTTTSGGGTSGDTSGSQSGDSTASPTGYTIGTGFESNQFWVPRPNIQIY
eukprot:gene5595-6963_t